MPDQEFSLDFPDLNQVQETQSQEVPQPDEKFESVADGFLKNIPDQDRPIVEKYVRDWDRGVTSRFQKIHDTYKPYKDLGDIEQIQVAMQLQAMIDHDPLEFFHKYQAAIQELQEQGLMDPFDNYNDDGVEDELQGGNPQQTQYNNDPAVMQQLEALQSQLNEMGQNWNNYQQSQQEQQEMQVLDNYMADLQNRHGQFNEDYVLLMMSRGMDGDQAVHAWKEASGQIGASRPTPQKLFGGGGHPGQPEMNLSNKKDRMALVEEIARRANQG